MFASQALPLISLLVLSQAVAHPTVQRPIRTSDDDVRRGGSFKDDEGALQYVNPKIGTADMTEPNDSAGMIPSVCPPFGMTRWSPQTRESYISQVCYMDADPRIHGFQATHQPAIWMGEFGQVVVVPGTGAVQPLFQDRGLEFLKQDEKASPYVYEVLLNGQHTLNRDFNATAEAAGYGPVPGGAATVPNDVKEGSNGRARRALEDKQDGYDVSIKAAMTAETHAGFLRFDFSSANGNYQPWVFIEASRFNWLGSAHIDPERQEVYGFNTERDDYMLGPDKARGFKAYFVSRFSEPFTSYGVSDHGDLIEGKESRTGNFTGAYVRFLNGTARVEVRTAMSFVSYDQAKKNLEIQLPQEKSFKDTVDSVKTAWLEKLSRVTIEGTNKTDSAHDPQTIFYTALYHALQYPSDYSEPTAPGDESPRVLYSGYTDSVHESLDPYHQSWSIWDTFRAEHSLLTLFAPERVNGMMRSLLKIYDWTGRTPIWASVVETNIMIATYADTVLANALVRGFNDFDIPKAWEAVHKDAYVPPINDTKTLYYDRKPGTSYEARAGLSSYMEQGWVSKDAWSESASRTLDYAFNDYACVIVGEHAGAPEPVLRDLRRRTKNYANLWNSDTHFMQARNGNGSFANENWGWTEGDHWVYTFDVMHDVAGLARLFGGAQHLKEKLDEHFNGKHNQHSNEPSHHIPYLYAMIGYPIEAADRIRSIAQAEYNNTSQGMSGNEDLGQMSAWYIFSALGFYPVNPASDEYVVGTPFFEKVTIRFPPGVASGGCMHCPDAEEKTLTISAPGAPSRPYIKGLSIDGRPVLEPIIKHADLVSATTIRYDMSDSPTSWGQGQIW